MAVSSGLSGGHWRPQGYPHIGKAAHRSGQSKSANSSCHDSAYRDSLHRLQSSDHKVVKTSKSGDRALRKEQENKVTEQWSRYIKQGQTEPQSLLSTSDPYLDPYSDPLHGTISQRSTLLEDANTIPVQFNPAVPEKTKAPRDSMSLVDRKRYLIKTPSEDLIMSMKTWVNTTYALLPVSRIDKECWLHPQPPPPDRNGRATGRISRAYSWRDAHGLHKVDVNFGVIALFVKDLLTDEDKRGYYRKNYHLSHLCGNWTCTNFSHFIIEPASRNIRRNDCFNRGKSCIHLPPCQVHLKQKILPGVHDRPKPDSEPSSSLAKREASVEQDGSDGIDHFPWFMGV